jgi:alkylation response protein AidB-like acyl-CoA dehydrogenase
VEKYSAMLVGQIFWLAPWILWRNKSLFPDHKTGGFFMSLLTQYHTAQALEFYLGDPLNPDNLFSFQHCMELDEQDAYPEDICQLLSDWNVDLYYIPAAYGGKLKSFEEVLAISRTIARRDLTVAIAHGVTYLGATPVWIAGSDEQKQKIADRIKNQEKISFCLTEKNHGSDILSSETAVETVENGYLLTGEKWLIGNATLSKALTVFTRTNPQGGPRGFSVFFVEKDKLDPNSFSHLAKIKTHGVRGANIGGVNFQNSFLPPDALISTPGSGLEIILKALQVTRTLHAGAAPSLAQADTALRVTLDFVFSRQIYGGSVWDIPHARQTLVEAFVDILLCECVSFAAVRSLHVATNQMSLFSSIIKYFVPTTVEQLIHRISAVLGARYYLREEHWYGIFQKIVRDHSIISVFDGSTAVNLHAIALQLQQLAAYHVETNISETTGIREKIATIFNLEKPLPDFDPNLLEIYNRGRDDILQGIELAEADLADLPINSEAESQVVERIINLTNLLNQLIHIQNQFLLEQGIAYTPKYSKSSQLFDLAKTYCVLHTAVACLQMWLHNRKTLDSFFAQGEWLVICLTRLLEKIQPSLESAPESYWENMGDRLVKLHTENKMFSIIPFELANSSTVEQK